MIDINKKYLLPYICCMKKDIIIDKILDYGGRLTSSYHPEGDTYTLTNKGIEFSISPLYKMIDIQNFGRAWYKDLESFIKIIETGEALDYRFK